MRVKFLRSFDSFQLLQTYKAGNKQFYKLQ